MVTDLFDPTRIDAAVSEAFGTRTMPRPPAQPAAPSRRASVVSDDLLDRLRMVESGKDPLAVNKETKAMGPYQFLPETVQMLHRQGVKFNPFDEKESREAARTYLGQLVQRHGGNIELALKDYGGFVTKDPTKYVQSVIGTTTDARPALETSTTTTPGALTVDDLMKPQAIDAAVSEAFGTPPKKGAVASAVTRFLRSSAGLTDTIVGSIQSLPGMAAAEVTYPIVRAGEALGVVKPGTAERGREAMYKTLVEPYQRPVGTMLGITETPEYKGEATQQLMSFISQNIDKGADWISKRTGLSKADVENMINVGLAGAPGLKTTKAGQAVSREVGYVAEAAKQAGGKVVGAAAEITPGFIQRPVTRAVEAIAPGTTTMPTARPTLGAPAAAGAAVTPPVTGGRVSVGAAAAPNTAMISQALQYATPEFQQLYGNLPLDKVKNTNALLVRLEGDSLPVPVRFTEGQATGNVKLLSEEMNMRGSDPRIAQFLNDNNQALIDNLPAIRSQAAPNSFATTRFEAAQNLIDLYKKLDADKNTNINAKYEDLRQAAGGNLSVDAKTLVNNIDKSLTKELLLTDGQGLSPYKELKGLAETGQMTFDQYLALRRNLSRLSAEAKDGNIRQAARLMVQQLDDLPLTAETAALKPLADAARQAAKDRFDALKRDPAYKAAVEDTVPADKYFDKFVINGINKNLNTMINTFGRDSLAHQNMISGTMQWLSGKALGKGVEGRQNFSAANFEGGLQHLRGNKNFEQIFNPETRTQLEILSKAASRHNFQPKGAYINNSNTFTSWMANRAQQLGDVAGFKFAGGIPVGTMIRQRIQESKTKTRGDRALDPMSGIVED